MMMRQAIPRWFVIGGLLASLILGLALIGAHSVEAHERWVTIHNGNDAGRVTPSHAAIQACDGTSNGHPFGIQGQVRDGRIATSIESNPDQLCKDPYNPDGMGDFVRIRWVCHGEHGPWRST
jgi:uncharacterized protein YwbE